MSWFGSAVDQPPSQWLSIADLVKAGDKGTGTPKVSEPSVTTPKVSTPSARTPKAGGEQSASGGGGGASAMLGKEMPGHTWISREAKGTHPDGGVKYAYRYSMQQGLGRQAKAGQEINVGYGKDRAGGTPADAKNVVRVKGTSAHGVTFEHQGKEQAVSHEDWHKFMTSHFGDDYTKAVDSTVKKWGNAVYKHVPKETFDMLWDKPEGKSMSAQQITQHLSDATYKIGKTTVGKKLQSAFKRIGVDDEAAVHHMIGHVLSRRNWDNQARAGMIGAAAFSGGFEAARVARNYKSMALSAERAAGPGKKVTAEHVFAAVKKGQYRNISQWHEHKLKSQHARLAAFNEHRVASGLDPVQLQKKNADDKDEPDGMLELERHARGQKLWESRKAGDSVNKAAFARMPKPHEDPEGFAKWLDEQDNVFRTGKRTPDADKTKQGGTEGFKRQFLDYVVPKAGAKKEKSAGDPAVSPLEAHSQAAGHTPEQAKAHAANVRNMQEFQAKAAEKRASNAKADKAAPAGAPAPMDKHGGRPDTVDVVHGILAKIPAADKKSMLGYITAGSTGQEQVDRIKALVAQNPWLHPSALYELLRQHRAGGGVQGTPPAAPGAGSAAGARPTPVQQAPAPQPKPPAPAQPPATTATTAPEQSAGMPTGFQPNPAYRPEQSAAAPAQAPATTATTAPEQATDPTASELLHPPEQVTPVALEQSASEPQQAQGKSPHPLASIADWQQAEGASGTSDRVTASLEHHALPVRALIQSLDRESLKDPAISAHYDALAEMTPEQRAQQKVHIRVDSEGNPHVTSGHAALAFANVWNQQSIPARVEYMNGGESVEHKANPAVSAVAPRGSLHPDRMDRILREHIADGHVPPKPSAVATQAPSVQEPAQPQPEAATDIGPGPGTEDAENPAELGSHPMTATEELLTGAEQHVGDGDHAGAVDQLLHAGADMASGHATAEQLDQADAVAERIDTAALRPEQVAQLTAFQEHLDELRQKHSAETPEEVAQHLTEQVVHAAVKGDDATVAHIEHLVHTAEPDSPEAAAATQVLAAVEGVKKHRAVKGSKDAEKSAIEPFDDPDFHAHAQAHGEGKGLNVAQGHAYAQKLLAYAKENPKLPGKFGLWDGKVAGLGGKNLSAGGRDKVSRFVYEYLQGHKAPETAAAAPVAAPEVAVDAPAAAVPEAAVDVPAATSEPAPPSETPKQDPEVITRPRRRAVGTVPEQSAAVETSAPAAGGEQSVDTPSMSASISDTSKKPDILERVRAERAAADAEGLTPGELRKRREIEGHKKTLAETQQMLRRLHRERVSASPAGRKLLTDALDQRIAAHLGGGSKRLTDSMHRQFAVEVANDKKKELEALDVPPGHPSVNYGEMHPQRRAEERQHSAQARASMSALDQLGVTDYERVPEHHMEPLRDTPAEQSVAVPVSTASELANRKNWKHSNKITQDPDSIRTTNEIYAAMHPSEGQWKSHLLVSKPVDPDGAKSVVDAITAVLPPRDYGDRKGVEKVPPHEALKLSDPRMAAVRAAIEALDPATRDKTVRNAQRYLHGAVPNDQQRGLLFGNFTDRDTPVGEIVAQMPAPPRSGKASDDSATPSQAHLAPELQPEHKAALEQAIDAAPADDGVDNSEQPIDENTEEQSAAFAGKVVPEQADGQHEGQHDALIDHTKEELSAAGKDPDATMETLANANKVAEESAAVEKPSKGKQKSEPFTPKLWAEYSPGFAQSIQQKAAELQRVKRAVTVKNLISRDRENARALEKQNPMNLGKHYAEVDRAIKDAAAGAEARYDGITDEHIKEILQMHKHGYDEDAHNRALGRPTEDERTRAVNARTQEQSAAEQRFAERLNAAPEAPIDPPSQTEKPPEGGWLADEVQRTPENAPRAAVSARDSVGTHRPPEGTKMDRVGWAAHEDARDVYDHKNTPHEDWPSWAQMAHDDAVAESDARDTPKMTWDEHLAATGRAPASTPSAAPEQPIEAPAPHQQAVAAVKADPQHAHLAPALEEAAKDYHDPEALKDHVLGLAQKSFAQAKTVKEQHQIADSTAQFLHAQGSSKSANAALRDAHAALSQAHPDVLDALPKELHADAHEASSSAANMWRQGAATRGASDKGHELWQHSAEAKDIAHAKPESRIKSLLNHWLPKLGHKIKQGLVGSLAAMGIMGAMGSTPSADAQRPQTASAVSVDLPGEGPKMTTAPAEKEQGEATRPPDNPEDDNYHVGPEQSYLANEWKLQHPDMNAEEFADADRMEVDPETGHTELWVNPHTVKLTGNPIADKAIKLAQRMDGKTYFGLGLSGHTRGDGKIGYQCSSIPPKVAGTPAMDTSAIYHDAKNKNKHYAEVKPEDAKPGDMAVYPDYKIGKTHHEGHVAILVDTTPGNMKIVDASKSDNGLHVRKLHPSFVFMPKSIVVRAVKGMQKSYDWDTLEEPDIYGQV